ncbi:MAG: hypothetical protein KTV77_03330 [Wolbachia endosymbiont of Fragariocoptes setiger]|nr:hypothetical protein [Wolbachia endosymbiont of Fragariocoptes setiger]
MEKLRQLLISCRTEEECINFLSEYFSEYNDIIDFSNLEESSGSSPF